MFNFFKNLYRRFYSKRLYYHFAAVAKKDKSGRIRYRIYIDGKLCKEEISFSGWYSKKIGV